MLILSLQVIIVLLFIVVRFLWKKFASFTVSANSGDEKQKIVLKLNKQFAHPSADSLKSFMHFDKEINQLTGQVTKNCVTCKHYKKSPPRSVVCMPMAIQFNEVVVIDLKHFRCGICFLHLIDLYTRFSLAKIIKSKHLSVIIQNVFMWVANGFGTPEKPLIHNGGELANESYKEMAEQFNVEICSTAAESPRENGICE